MSFRLQLPVLLLAVAAAATCLSSLPSAADAAFFTPCTKLAYPIVIKKVVLRPDPAVAGEELKFRISASTRLRVISGGVVHCHLAGPNSVSERSTSLCLLTQCPVTRGDFVLAGAHSLAANSSPGRYTLTLRVVDTRGFDLACERIVFDVKAGELAVDVADDGDEADQSIPFVF